MDAVRYPYIQVNTHWRYSYLLFDVDKVGAEFTAYDLGLPTPTIIVVNPFSGHAHYAYELKSWVAPDKHPKAASLYRAVTDAMRRALGADLNYAGNVIQNPLHPSWRVLIQDQRPDLNTLALSVTDDLKFYQKFEPPPVPNQDGRNCTLFDAARQHGYAIVKDCRSPEDLKARLRSCCVSLNTFSPPLSGNEIECIVRSVNRFVWRNRDHFSTTKRNRGVLGLPPIEAHDEDERRIEIARRQSKGAVYSHRQQRNSTEEAIVLALEKLPTASPIEIARLANLHAATVYRYLGRTGK